MEVDELKRSISTMTDEEIEERLLAIRAERRKPPPKKKKKSVDKAMDVGNLTIEQMEALLAEMEGGGE